jgi:hypothetical protein
MNSSLLLAKHTYNTKNIDLTSKVKFTLEETRKAQRASRGIALLFL